MSQFCKPHLNTCFTKYTPQHVIIVWL